MPYFERLHASSMGRGPGEGGVLCDRCGFAKHHRPTQDDDIAPLRLDEITECEGWSWDPIGQWCWNPTYSSEPRPCDDCGRDVNVQVPLYVIGRELKDLAAA